MVLVLLILGAGLILLVLLDAFETIVLPRRINQPFRLTSVFYRGAWPPWRWLASRLPAGQRESFLGFFGPLSLIFLLALWVALLILGFALLHFGVGSDLVDPDGTTSFKTDLYYSGTTFFTIGLGDVNPESSWARALTVVEGGTGFGLLALVIGYLPVLYQSFSRREAGISLLDARAGSPPSAVELLRRLADAEPDGLPALLADWERWSAQLLESYLSYPVLALFRSHHDRQSWVGALTFMLDTCALLMATEQHVRPARITFAMSRHAAVDLAQVYGLEPRPPNPPRLPAAYDTLGPLLAELPVSLDERSWLALAELRALYEPYVHALAHFLALELPPWWHQPGQHDDWQTVAERVG